MGGAEGGGHHLPRCARRAAPSGCLRGARPPPRGGARGPPGAPPPAPAPAGSPARAAAASIGAGPGRAGPARAQRPTARAGARGAAASRGCSDAAAGAIYDAQASRGRGGRRPAGGRACCGCHTCCLNITVGRPGARANKGAAEGRAGGGSAAEEGEMQGQSGGPPTTAGGGPCRRCTRLPPVRPEQVPRTRVRALPTALWATRGRVWQAGFPEQRAAQGAVLESQEVSKRAGPGGRAPGVKMGRRAVPVAQGR